MNAVIGGYIKTSVFSREQFPLLENPSERDMQSTVSRVRGKFGVVSMERQDGNEEGAYELVLYAEGGTYLLMLYERLAGGELEVRTHNNPRAADEFVEVLGEMHHASTLLTDFDVVRRAFSEFRATGDVSRELLG